MDYLTGLLDLPEAVGVEDPAAAFTVNWRSCVNWCIGTDRGIKYSCSRRQRHRENRAAQWGQGRVDG